MPGVEQRPNGLTASLLSCSMAAVDIGARDVPPVPVDDLENIFNYEVDNDLIQDVHTNVEIAARQPGASKTGRAAVDGGLGLDEEIKISKKRTPVAKLDEGRLLSQGGIPKLRRTVKERLKFKGKGHEYSDVAKLLNFYQLWLDDLYPRAKFADGLAIIEDVGHRKQMQMMRKEWINEGKARRMPRVENQQKPSWVQTETWNRPHTHAPAREKSQESDDSNGRDTSLEAHGAANGHGSGSAGSQRLVHSVDHDLFFSDGEGAANESPRDELDALLAEDEARYEKDRTLPPSFAGRSARREVNFDDEEEAMAGMDDMW